MAGCTTRITWEDQGTEQVELAFDLYDEDRVVDTAFLVKEAQDGAHKKVIESLHALLQGVDGRPFRLTITSVGEGTAVALFGHPSKPTIKSVDVGGTDLATLLEAAAAICEMVK